MDAVIESYYLETTEGLFFAVKGLEHPPDRYIAVLRYAPDPDGDRRKGDVPYRRLYQFAEQEDLIRSSCPHYLSYDTVFQTTLQSVPRRFIRHIHDPRLRLREIVREPSKSIHRDLTEFAMLLQREGEVPPAAIGVSGSVLVSLETESSDLDISIFGKENCERTYRALTRLLDSNADPRPRRLNNGEIEALYVQRSAETYMDFGEFSVVEKRKTCQGVWRGRPYFIRFLKSPHEAGTQYGNLRYAPLGRAAIAGVISSDEEAFYTPCRYSLSDVEGAGVKVREIVSFRGRFCEQARAGQAVRASGTLERVESALGEIHYRLLVGNSPQDTIGLRH